MRKIIQIVVPGDNSGIIALSDDGKIFCFSVDKDAVWYEFPPLPEPEKQNLKPELIDEKCEGCQCDLYDIGSKPLNYRLDGDSNWLCIDCFSGILIAFESPVETPISITLTNNEYTPTEWPEGALWWAVDENQSAWFYSGEVEQSNTTWYSISGSTTDKDANYPDGKIPDWRTSKRKRPENI